MFRYGAALRHRLATPVVRQATKPTGVRNLSFNRTLQTHRPSTLALVRFQSTTRHVARLEDKLADLQPHPEEVSTTSTVQTSLDQLSKPKEEEEEIDMTASIRSDMKTIRETFSLAEVPRDAFLFGIAGVAPYALTSATTVALAYDLNTSFIMDPKTAEMLLHVLEPIQIGYGAVIISFLGAIHIGAEFTRYHGTWRERYIVGTLAPAAAWASTLLPVETALITQFLAMISLYYVDSNASTKGHFPGWYGMYRFVLTLLAGTAIVVSLIGRGQVSEYSGAGNGALGKVKEWRAQREQLLMQEEEAREEAMAEEEESED